MRKNYYYIAPIELWRGFMEEPDKILNDVLAFQTAAYSTKEQAEEALGVSYGSWEETIKRGVELRGKKSKYCGLCFDIPRILFWDYLKDTKTEWDNLLLLALLAHKTIGGRHGDIRSTNSEFMFARMAGYRKPAFLPKPQMLKSGEVKYGEGAKLHRYMKDKRTMSRYGAMLRLDLMNRFNNFHCYSQKGKRGYVFTFGSEHPRETYIKMMIATMGARGNDAKRKALKETIKAIQHKVGV